MGSFVRVDDRICGNDWVGGGDPLENRNLIIGWARADSYVYDLGMVVWCAWMTKCVSKIGWWQTISSGRGSRFDTIRYSVKPADARLTEHAVTPST